MNLFRPTCFFVLLVSIGCSADGGSTHLGSHSDPSQDAGNDDATADATADVTDDVQTTDSIVYLDSINPEIEAPPPTGEVYAHSDTTLYKLEPISKTVTVMGTFDCVTATGGGLGMWDIALDKDGKMFGTVCAFSSSSLVRIDTKTAHCDVIATAATLPNSLAFIPAGILDPDEEVLVGFDRSDYVRIDKGTGALQKIGSLNPNATGNSWESSGDIVSIIGDKTYVTVKPEGAQTYPSDSIVEIDPLTGKVLKVIGITGFSSLWGLGYWGGIAYGFSEGGELCEIDLTTGKGTKIPIPNLSSGLSFWGAGVTTAAPIQMPK